MKNTDLSKDNELPGDLVAEWRHEAIRKGQRPEEFWSQQQMRIRARLQSRSVRKARSLWLAVVTAALMFLAVLLTTTARPRPQMPPPQATVDADQELLLEVERALSAGTPEALQPLTLLVEASSNHTEAQPTSHKEHRHEN